MELDFLEIEPTKLPLVVVVVVIVVIVPFTGGTTTDVADIE